ncbi:helix-turn-helix domain-containing protein [Streptomyces abikoensis]|uniref:helix-turn-helix domain-containing protein n=1 Tax=Streptomyces abikoensis TaxID=97398 RepID=UPI003723C5AB
MSPTVRLRRLAAELRRLRAGADLTREDVAEQTGINTATLYRIETARVRPQRRTLVALLNLYGVRESQRDEVLALSEGASVQGWLRPYHSELPEEYTAYISFEAEARAVRNYESLFVPGLLQTEDYARAVIKGVLPMASAREIEQRVQARVERQAVLVKDDPLHLWAIMDEAALRRMVGGRDVMHKQLQHLTAVAQEPHMTLQVIPFGAGAHAGMPGSFVLMSFPEAEDPEIVYIDSMAGDLFLEAEADIRRYGAIFDNLRAVALSPDDTSNLIAALAKETQ